MVALVDASVIIDIERGGLAPQELLALAQEETIEIAFATMTVSELLQGVHRARTARQRSGREAFVERLLALAPTASFDTAAARAHARIAARLAAAGTPVGAHDLVIAATAVANGAAVATRDRRSFPKIDEVRTLYW